MYNRKYYELNKINFYLKIIILILISLIVGYLIGYVSSHEKINNKLNYYNSLIEESNDNYLNEIVKQVDSNRIREHLKELTSYSHIAGKLGDRRSADYVYNEWKKQGLDYVKLIDYDVLLSYPNNSLPNNIEILDANNNLEELINTTEPIIDNELNNITNEIYSFLAYSLNGTVTSDKIYYVNYCTNNDYEYLVNIKKINLTNTIVICRYGRIFRGDKVMLGQQLGVKAVILYDDPARTAPPGIVDNELYPNGEFLPQEGTQRGSIFTGSGDPLTHLYPSTEYSYRNNENKINELPKILATVIGYKHARKIFKLLENNEQVENNDWKGSLANIKYTYGGKLKLNKKLKININNYREINKIYNVIGILNGYIEPDQYILVGNHRDAWILGSIDPTSGTSSMLEVSRVLSYLRENKNWIPKRSILFLSWSAEEYGLIGSTEFVEEFNKKLIKNSIAYLNMDIGVQGNYSFTAKSNPLLFNLIYNVTKNIKMIDNNSNNESVYDRWLKYTNDDRLDNEKLDKPFINSQLSASSDYMSFEQRIGIPCLDIRFNHDKSFKYKSMASTSYALYHTSYETFKLIDKYIDPNFNSFKLITQILSEITRKLSDELIIPFDLLSYSNEMISMYNKFNNEYGFILKNKNINEFENIKNVILNFTQVSNNFISKLNSINRNNIYLIRQFNDQLKNIEKCFIDFNGLKRSGYLNMLNAPSLYNRYASNAFPSLSDSIYKAIKEQGKSLINDELNWNKIKFEISLVIYVIQSAIHQLQSPLSFDRYPSTPFTSH
jgi:N-acetylated-alpha-linked acidic dipeptidase